MLEKELIVGEVYCLVYQLKERYIFLHNGSKETNYVNGSYYNIKGNLLCSKNMSFIDGNYEIPTPLEKAHLLECIKQNKFVSLKDIKVTQEIQWLWN